MRIPVVVIWSAVIFGSPLLQESTWAVGPKGETTGQFLVFDGTLYKNKPNLAKYGISPINIIYVSSLFPGNEPKENLPHRDRVSQIAKRLPVGSWVVVDIEHWPVRGGAAVVADTVRKYNQTLEWFHEESGNLKIGLYGVLPAQDYHRAIKGPGNDAYRDWQRDNDRLALITQQADALFPSLYTFYPDREGWVRYAIEQIREARRFGKPVYVFLWPQYHESNRLLGGMFLARDYWGLQLRTARKYADGIIIWGGWENGPAKWREDAPWWQETKIFMSELIAAQAAKQ